MFLKLLSGRYLLTVVIAGVFAKMAMAGQLPQDKVMEIILLVIYGYFSRVRTTENGGEKK